MCEGQGMAECAVCGREEVGFMFVLSMGGLSAICVACAFHSVLSAVVYHLHKG